MSANIFLLDGWDDTSVWGLDDDYYYAQLTPNDVDDANGPQVWITPPRYLIGSANELMRTIAAVLDLPADLVDQAMARGLAISRGEPVVSVPISGATSSLRVQHDGSGERDVLRLE
ncbi:hypothetical protein [Pseudonocardia sp. SID8383]|uniref:hypothetical protein n=1 Tax=Pseudonocardia sp. SID8383 TaxID=2690363 RepID=UPI0013705906|nr:hypothetical protein [Pseudonocardia sp. SID8383]MYW71917.1 hypothetical protein [Pseudonocardia sp. SID8383]